MALIEKPKSKRITLDTQKVDVKWAKRFLENLKREKRLLTCVSCIYSFKSNATEPNRPNSLMCNWFRFMGKDRQPEPCIDIIECGCFEE